MKTTIKKPRLVTSQELTQAERIVLSNFRKLNRGEAGYILMLCEGFGAAADAAAGAVGGNHLRLVSGGAR
jgi:hypothetical protein